MVIMLASAIVTPSGVMLVAGGLGFLIFVGLLVSTLMWTREPIEMFDRAVALLAQEYTRS